MALCVSANRVGLFCGKTETVHHVRMYVYTTANCKSKHSTVNHQRQETGMHRDIQRLPTTTFSLLLRKEYFDCPQRDSVVLQL